ncbi:MAG: sigma 54-interacting transcriptional regulator [Planctomycetes bacterium]|nr:sigma 54-interacting transcriptional regulator [Planctomycetota bacterium]
MRPRVFNAATRAECYRALVAVCETVVVDGTLDELLASLAEPMGELIGGELGVLIVPEEERISVEPLFPAARPLAESLDPALAQLAVRAIPDFHTPAAGPLEAAFREAGADGVWLFPLRSERKVSGLLALGTGRAFAEEELDAVVQATRLLALALEALEARRHALAFGQALSTERDRLQALLEIGSAVATHLDLHELLPAVQRSLSRLMPCEWASLSLLTPDQQAVQVLALEYAGGRGLVQEGDVVPLDESPASHALRSAAPIHVGSIGELDAPHSDLVERLRGEGLGSGVIVPLRARERVLGSLDVASRREHAFSADDVALLQQVANHVAPAVANALAYQEIRELRDRLAAEKRYLETDLRRLRGDHEILGESPALKAALAQVQQVAATPATVLLTGETGTGKELFARAVHELSPRSGGPFVAINCAAIPTGLLESELFGHEKGAFTGASERRLGRFEMASGGTLFLDEVGEVPLELQTKLLRVLQELRFERIGGRKTIKADVRIVAATNRDLQRLVDAGEFRSDLYYRLNVFPITLPPLRERPGDVPILAQRFLARAARRLGRQVQAIPAPVLQALTRHDWPGNVRELANAIERCVILSPGTELELPFALSSGSAPAPSAALALPLDGEAPSTFAEWERAIIQHTLDACDWVIGGPSGAASRLGLARTTLQSRMRKLGITRPS